MENRYVYRGKTISGSWVQGLLAHKDDKWYISNKAGMPFAFEIRPESICQCTGIKDKNGTLIYENDIMEAHLDDEFPEDVARTKVVWEKNGWVTSEPGTVDREYLDDFDTEYFEVVGNIFDNPELLEV